jgi:hypothetical protein
MSHEQPSNGLPRLWSWTCPICGMRTMGDMLSLSQFRVGHLRTCVPPDADDTIGIVRSKKWRRRDYDR